MVTSSLPAARHRAAWLLAGALFAAPAFSEQLASVKVPPAALRMLEIAPVQAPEAGQLLWSPARLEYPSGQLDSVVSPAQARVTAIHVQPGQAVKAGAPLATLVSADALRMRHEVSAAQLAAETSRAELQRQQDMVARGVGTENELRLAQARNKEAAQELARARGTAALLGSDGGDRIVLRAPHAGVVAQHQASMGQLAEAGALLFAIGNPQALGVVAEVFEADLPLLKTGVAAQVQLPTGSAPVTARVQQVGAVVNAESRRAPVQLALTDKQLPEGLRAGMQARVGITIDGPAQMRIPVGAVLIQGENRNVVFVQTAEQAFEARTVQLGAPVRGWVPVISGLKSGERIVVRGALLLDGAASQML
ncbi:efflux RND transporter periplasmic adaptor subunit [Comamonas endophytica]|uniref:Efflux RND transporter periplasmic adaptor subunit n=1 Tax=Comamonas endophytica TaxID=2949090 RepID=A0ABY6GC05_9BURK|nr:MULTISPECIES: efflux RND transporter periplasmic adaptor subunit [unclassified Acidovorax]MCD2512226.1 efflux RND transporter periplasmic adaptor subunit [Acidovorax sp. D4N7]UYG51994.1 efflux RND transporter periplasmic adaptor subunit [Acidovorax sp. 5MLIR]